MLRWNDANYIVNYGDKFACYFKQVVKYEKYDVNYDTKYCSTRNFKYVGWCNTVLIFRLLVSIFSWIAVYIFYRPTFICIVINTHFATLANTYKSFIYSVKE